MINQDVLLKWFKGDAQAAMFAQKVWEAAQTWDDIVDEGETEHINTLVSFMAFDIDLDPFFQRHAGHLKPSLLSMYLQWRDATTLEQSGDINDINKAYMLRAGIYTLFNIIAWLVGGERWSSEIGPEIYRAYGETLEEFREEMNA